MLAPSAKRITAAYGSPGGQFVTGHRVKVRTSYGKLLPEDYTVIRHVSDSTSGYVVASRHGLLLVVEAEEIVRT